MKKLIIGLALLTSLAASAADECSIYIEKAVKEQLEIEPLPLEKEADVEKIFEENMILKGYNVVEKKEDANYLYKVHAGYGNGREKYEYIVVIIVKTAENQKGTRMFHESRLGHGVTLGYTIDKKIKDCY